MAMNSVTSQTIASFRRTLKTCMRRGTSLAAPAAGLILIGATLLSGCVSSSPSSPELPDESPGAVSVIGNTGSDTLVNLALAWAETYTGFTPNVRISVTGGGSGTGIAALINGTVDIANASRAMKAEEIELAEGNGVSPVEWVVALDASPFP